MKIPGLEAAMERLDVLEQEMIPLLREIAEGVKTLVELTEIEMGIDSEE